MRNYKNARLFSSPGKITSSVPFAPLILILLVLSGWQISSAQESRRWSFVGTDANGIRFFIERPLPAFDESADAVRKVWIKLVFDDESYKTNLYRWRCGKRQFSTMKTVFYAADGKLLKSLEIERRWQEYPPDSSAELLYKLICGESVLEDDADKRRRLTDENAAANKNPENRRRAAEVNVETANIRSGPSTSAEVIGRAGLGMVFELTGARRGGWYEIQLPGAATAWLHGNTIRFVE